MTALVFKLKLQNAPAIILVSSKQRISGLPSSQIVLCFACFFLLPLTLFTVAFNFLCVVLSANKVSFGTISLCVKIGEGRVGKGRAGTQKESLYTGED